jgi:hypothetical protein
MLSRNAERVAASASDNEPAPESYVTTSLGAGVSEDNVMRASIPSVRPDGNANGSVEHPLASSGNPYEHPAVQSSPLRGSVRPSSARSKLSSRPLSAHARPLSAGPRHGGGGDTPLARLQSTRLRASVGPSMPPGLMRTPQLAEPCSTRRSLAGKFSTVGASHAWGDENGHIDRITFNPDVRASPPQNLYDLTKRSELHIAHLAPFRPPGSSLGGAERSPNKQAIRGLACLLALQGVWFGSDTFGPVGEAPVQAMRPESGGEQLRGMVGPAMAAGVYELAERVDVLLADCADVLQVSCHCGTATPLHDFVAVFRAGRHQASAVY